MSDPLLSVVIPSKNRADYAVACIQSLLRLSGDLEVVVQDNSETPGLGARLAELADSRIRYEHRPGPLSVIDNCSLGMARARGEYLTLLGDDDGVGGELMAVTRWAARAGIDAVTPSHVAWYVWPDVRFALYGDAFAGTLAVRPFSGRVSEQDPTRGIRRSMREGFQNLLNATDLPKLYYGLVHRRCLSALLAEAGTLFPGVSPDMSVAAALTKYVGRFVSIDYPVFLQGISAKSTAGAGARKEHVGRLEDQAHLPKGCAATWPAELPAVFSVQTVWAQSGLASLRATGRGDLAAGLDLGLVYGMCGTLNRGFWPVILPTYWRAADARGQSRLAAGTALATGVGRTWVIRARYLLGRLARRPWYVGERVESGHRTIAEAAAALDRWVARRGPRPALDGFRAGAEGRPS
jgi:hypothetical protein